MSSYKKCSREKLAVDLFGGLKFVRLEILSSSFIDFVRHHLPIFVNYAFHLKLVFYTQKISLSLSGFSEHLRQFLHNATPVVRQLILSKCVHKLHINIFHIV